MVTYDFKSGNKTYVTYKCDTLAEAATVLKEKFVSEPIEVRSSNKSYGFFDFNICLKSEINKQTCRVEYNSGESEITWVEFNAKHLNDFANLKTRNVSSFEYHYFPGVSASELNNYAIPMYTWKRESIYKEVSVIMSGSYDFLIDADKIKEVINYIKGF